MSMTQVGNGWLDTSSGKYTVYNPQTGQLQTQYLNVSAAQRNDPNFIQSLTSNPGQLNQYLSTNANYLGGRSNVNLSGQIGQATNAIMQQYPQMSKDDAMRYANQWVADRIAHGQDANQVEDFAKGAFRDDKNLGPEMLKGINDMISRDEFNSKPGDSTGASTAPQGDGRGSIQDELRAFAGRMMSVLPPDSPQVKRIAELAAQAGNKYAEQSGLGPGGITSTGVANTAARANVDLQTQREGIGANALAAAGNQQLSVDALNTQLQQGNQQANTLQGANIGGLIGSGIGAIGGIVGSAYTGGAMAPAIPGLIAAGGAGGQALGGTIANGSQPPIRYGGNSGSAPQSAYKGRSWGTS